MIVYRELSSLVQDLGYSARTLYGISNQIGRHYHPVSIPKADGGIRQLSVPDKVLKTVQKRIYEVLLAPEPISPYATAYRPGCSTKINARIHVGKHTLVKLDIYHFFDSVIYPLVKERIFPAERFSESNRILLSILCTFHEALPQGAPTSPAITNIIMREFDDVIGGWCRARGVCYSRYCDDMAFSGDFDPVTLIDLVKSELAKMGFFLNERKTSVVHDGQQKRVTGLVINEKVNATAAYRRKIRQEMHYCMRYGVASHMEHEEIDCPADRYLRKLLGQVNYVLSIAPNEPGFQDYKSWLIKQTT